jgi:hypothetical protein
MCGNFGLLQLGIAPVAPKNENTTNNDDDIQQQKWTDIDRSFHESLHEVSRLHGIRVAMGDEEETEHSMTDLKSGKNSTLLSPLVILQSQTAATEIRGGQSGGYSSLEYDNIDNNINTNKRVRLVARKRHPLAADLAALYREKGGRAPGDKATLTVIGHTRFATSSANQVSELHPHEWVPYHDEPVWAFNSTKGTFTRSIRSVGIHITHNGDFDALEAYSQSMVVDEVGLWLERILYVPNNCKGT